MLDNEVWVNVSDDATVRRRVISIATAGLPNAEQDSVTFYGGEGNWVNLQDDLEPLTFTNWVVDPNTVSLASDATKWNFTSASETYDYGILSVHGGEEVANGSGTSNATAAAGNWIPKSASGQHFYYNQGNFLPAPQQAKILIELKDTSITTGYLSSVKDHGYTDTTITDRAYSLLEMSISETAECGYAATDVCEYCLNETSFEFEQYNLDYLGQDDHSHYYATSGAYALKEIMEEYSADWDRIKSHLVVINDSLENDTLLKLMADRNIDRVWLGMTDSDTSGTDNEGNWMAMRNDAPIEYFNWHNDVSFDNASYICAGQDYSAYDFAQMWRVSGPYSRRYHDVGSCQEITPQEQVHPGEWVSLPNYGVIFSGAFLANVVLEFPKTDLEIVQGHDDDGNGVCSSNETMECLLTFSDVSYTNHIDLVAQDTSVVILFNGNQTYNPNRVVRVGTGQYRLSGVAQNYPVRLSGSQNLLSIDTAATTAGTYVGSELYFYGSVEFVCSGDFGTASLESPHGNLGTLNNLQFQYPNSDYNCVGLCEKDENYNYICDRYEGCTDSTACNFDATAAFDDNTCVDAAECTNCMDPTACNFDIDAIFAAPIDSCVFTLVECEVCTGEQDGTGEVTGGDSNGNGLCDQYEGCTDLSACNFKYTAYQHELTIGTTDLLNTLSSSCLYATDECEYCSGSTDGNGFVVTGDIDNDGVCDNMDSDRRIPLTMIWFGGANQTYSSITDTTIAEHPVQMTGAYLNDNSPNDFGFDVSDIETFKEINHTDIGNLQFGQDFNISIQDGGAFKAIFPSGIAGQPSLSHIADTVNVYQEVPFHGAGSTKGDPPPAWNAQEIDDAFTDSEAISISAALQTKFEFLNINGATDSIGYASASILSDGNRSSEVLKIAAFGTSLNTIAENGTSSSLPPCYDPSNYDFWETDFPLALEPSRCFEINNTYQTLGTASDITVELARNETEHLHWANNSYVGEFAHMSGTTQDYYFNTTSRNFEDAQGINWHTKYDGAALADLNDLTGTTRALILSTITSGVPIWVSGQLNMSTNGAITNTNVFKWTYYSGSDAFDFAGTTSHLPINSDHSRGPSFMSFPGLDGTNTYNSYSDVFSQAEKIGSSLYAISDNELTWNQWHNRYHSNSLKLDNGDEFADISNKYTDFKKAWIGTYRSGNTWYQCGTSTPNTYSKWVGNATPPTGLTGRFHNMSNARYAQLVRDTDYPVFTNSSRSFVSIGSSPRMVPVETNGNLHSLNSSVSGVNTTWRATCYHDVSGMWEPPSWSSRTHATTMPDRGALDIAYTRYYFLYAGSRNFESYFNYVKDIGATLATFPNKDHETWAASSNPGESAIFSGMDQTGDSGQQRDEQVMLDGSGRKATWGRWHGGEPNNGGEPHIEYWYRGNTLSWNDIWPHTKRNAAMIENHAYGGFESKRYP